MLPLETGGGAEAETKSGGTGKMKSLQDLRGRPNLEGFWLGPWTAGPGQVRSRPDQPRSYPSARIGPQILEVRAVNGLQGLQLVVLSLRIALLRLGPAASRGPAAPSHGGRGGRSGLGEVAVVHGRAMELSRRGDRAGGVALRWGGALKTGPPVGDQPGGGVSSRRPARGRGSARVKAAGAEPRAGGGSGSPGSPG